MSTLEERVQQLNLEAKARIESAKHAKEIVGWSLLELEERGSDQEHFWLTLAKLAAEKIGRKLEGEKTDSPKPMSDSEARKWEQKAQVPYGKYQFSKVADVPPDYWLVLKESPFNKDLERYLASDHFQKLQEEPE